MLSQARERTPPRAPPEARTPATPQASSDARRLGSGHPATAPTTEARSHRTPFAVLSDARLVIVPLYANSHQLSAFIREGRIRCKLSGTALGEDTPKGAQRRTVRRFMPTADS